MWYCQIILSQQVLIADLTLSRSKKEFFLANSHKKLITLFTPPPSKKKMNKKKPITLSLKHFTKQDVEVSYQGRISQSQIKWHYFFDPMLRLININFFPFFLSLEISAKLSNYHSPTLIFLIKKSRCFHYYIGERELFCIRTLETLFC